MTKPEQKAPEYPTPEQLAWGEPAIEYALATQWLKRELQQLGSSASPAQTNTAAGRIPEFLSSIKSVEFIKCDRPTTMREWEEAKSDRYFYQATICQAFGFNSAVAQALKKAASGNEIEFPNRHTKGTSRLGKHELEAFLSHRKNKLVPQHPDVSRFADLMETPEHWQTAFHILLREFSSVPYTGLTLGTLDLFRDGWACLVKRKGEYDATILTSKGTEFDQIGVPDLILSGVKTADAAVLRPIYMDFVTPLFRDPSFNPEAGKDDALIAGEDLADDAKPSMLAIPCWQQFGAQDPIGAYLGWLFITLSIPASALEELFAKNTIDLLRPALNAFLRRIVGIEEQAAAKFYAASLKNEIDQKGAAPGPLDLMVRDSGPLRGFPLQFEGYTLSDVTVDSAVSVVSDARTLYLVPTPLVKLPQADGTEKQLYKLDLQLRVSRQLSAVTAVHALSTAASDQGRMAEIGAMRDVMAHELAKFLPFVDTSVPAALLNEIRSFLAVIVAPDHAARSGGAEAYPREFGWGTTLRDFIEWQGLIALRMEVVLERARSTRPGGESTIAGILRSLENREAVQYLEYEGAIDYACRLSEPSRGYFALGLIAALRNCIAHSPILKITVRMDNVRNVLVMSNPSATLPVQPSDSRGAGGTKSVLQYFATKYQGDKRNVNLKAVGNMFETHLPLPPQMLPSADGAADGPKSPTAALEKKVYVVDDSPLRTQHVGHLIEMLARHAECTQKLGETRLTFVDGWQGGAEGAHADAANLAKALREEDGVWLLDINLPVESVIVAKVVNSQINAVQSTASVSQSSAPGRLNVIASLMAEQFRDNATTDAIHAQFKQLTGKPIFGSPHQWQSAFLLAACQILDRPHVTISTRQTGTEGDYGRAVEESAPVHNVHFPSERHRVSDAVLHACVKKVFEQVKDESAYFEAQFSRIKAASHAQWHNWTTRNSMPNLQHDLIDQSVDVAPEVIDAIAVETRRLLTTLMKDDHLDKIVSRGSPLLLPLLRGLHSGDDRSGVSIGILPGLFSEQPTTHELRGLVAATILDKFPNGVWVIAEQPGSFLRGLRQINSEWTLTGITVCQVRSVMQFTMTGRPKTNHTAEQDATDLTTLWQTRSPKGGMAALMRSWRKSTTSMEFSVVGGLVEWRAVMPVSRAGTK